MQASNAPAQVDTAALLSAFVRYLMTSCGRDFVQAIDDLELSLSQIKLLQILAASDELSLKDLGEELGLSLPALSRAVDGLVQRRLASRSEDPDDRRVKRVALTRKGRRLVSELVELRMAGLDDFVARLSARERAALDRALALLGDRDEIRAMAPR